MKKIIITILFATTISLFVAGCTTPEQESNIPWNTPAAWEGQGPLGGMINGY